MEKTVEKDFKVGDLSLHPIFKLVRQPEMAATSTEFRALVEDVRANGVMEPPKVTADGKIMDGRHRWRAAKEAGLETIRCVVRPDDEAMSVVVSSLAHRRHYTKAALAYVMWPVAAKYRDHGIRVRSGNLKTGNSKNTNVLPKADGIGIQPGKGLSLLEFADVIGVSTDTIQMAADLHARLEVSGDKVMRNGRTIRDVAEDMLFAQDKGFQPILAMIGFETKGKSHAAQCASGVRSNYGSYISDAIEKATKHFSKWDTIAAEDRQEVVDEITEFVSTWPKDVRSAVVEAAMKARA